MEAQPHSSEHTSVQYRKKAISYDLNQRLVRPRQQAIYDLFAKLFPPQPDWKVLDLGVNGSLESRDEYFFEASYPYLHNVVGSGLEDANYFSRFFPETTYVQGDRSGRLPFSDNEFDVVFCNAVIEHVGGNAAQAGFLREIFRVSKRCFVSTPNRWFPIEMHTVLPLVHYLPTPMYRKIFQTLGFEFFSKEENLNLLDRRAFRALVPNEPNIKMCGVPFLGFTANIVLARGAVEN